ncbi:MAG: heterocyst formation ABC transporter subunit HepA [Cyanobacteria bacterium P01_E01_bin.45]
MLKPVLSGLYKLSAPVLKRTNLWKRDRFILREFRHFYWLAIAALAFSALAAAFGGSTVGLIALFLQGLTEPDSPSFQTGLSWLDAWLNPVGAASSTRIFRVTFLLLLVSWMQSASLYLGLLFSGYARYRLVARLRKSIFRRLKSLKFYFFVNERSSNLLNTVTTELQKVENLFNIYSIFMIAALQALAFVAAMFAISWKISIFAFMLLSLLIGLVSLIRGRTRKASYALPKANEAVTAGFVEFINGIRTVHSYATYEHEQEKVHRGIDASERASREIAKLTALTKPISQALGSTAMVIVVAVAYVILSSNDSSQAAILITYLFALIRALPFVYQCLNNLSKISAERGSLDRITNLIDPSNKPLFENGELDFPGLQRSVDLVDISFSYVPGNPILNRIDLSFEKGKTTALVGSSGAGKSTIIDLLLRLIEPTDGKVLVDGIDLSQLDIESFRKKMAIVSQDTFIFNASVRDNIAYGLSDVDDSAIVEAARQANALDFIREMPEGMDTQLGDRGVRLSGGQRQRISIARALVRNPDILVLDEATSALDSVTEQLIQASLEKLVKGRTVIVIAHRLSTIYDADKVVVLDTGRVVEQGTYKELLDKQGQLWEFHQMQYRETATSSS